jgi:hypothetical protein
MVWATGVAAFCKKANVGCTKESLGFQFYFSFDRAGVCLRERQSQFSRAPEKASLCCATTATMPRLQHQNISTT